MKIIIGIVVLLAMLQITGIFGWSSTTDYPPGITAPDEPYQADIENAKPWVHQGYTITPLAEFSVTARVLGTRTYWFGRETDLSPVDFALGWEEMSDSDNLRQIKISQSNRFYYWKTSGSLIPVHTIVRQSANMHMIPARAEIERQLKNITVGEVVKIDGKLIRVDAGDGWHWISSLTRNDTGRGACETIWVESVAAVK